MLINNPLPTNTNFLITHNNFAGASPFANRGIGYEANTNSLTFNVSNNNFSNNQINFRSYNDVGKFTSGALTINNNVFILSGNIAESPTQIAFDGDGSTGPLTLQVKNNTWLNSTNLSQAAILLVNSSTTAKACLSLIGNQCDTVPVGYLLQNINSGPYIFNTGNNISNIGTIHTIGTVSEGSCN
jgi:hypothetical protein